MVILNQGKYNNIYSLRHTKTAHMVLKNMAECVALVAL